jgi:hypothetical protein
MGGKDAMHDIVNTDSMTDGAYTQEDGKAVIEEEEEEAVGEGGEYEEDDETIAIIAPAATTKGKKKASPKKGGGSRGPKWRSLEDECLVEAWKTVSIDLIFGGNQNCDTYWETLKVRSMNARSWIPCSTKLATSGMESNKRSWIGKKAEQASKIM